jgi:RNA exonuclease 1
VPAGTGRTSAVCDYSNIKNGHGARATKPVKCDNDDEVVEAMITKVNEHDLVFGRFMELANHLGCQYSPILQPPDRKRACERGD